MSKQQSEITTIIIESQQNNHTIARQFYRYILEELKNIKGEKENGKEKTN